MIADYLQFTYDGAESQPWLGRLDRDRRLVVLAAAGRECDRNGGVPAQSVRSGREREREGGRQFHYLAIHIFHPRRRRWRGADRQGGDSIEIFLP